MIKKYHSPHALPRYPLIIILTASVIGLVGAASVAFAHGREDTGRTYFPSYPTDTAEEQGARDLGEIGTTDRGTGDSGYPPDPCGLEVVGGKACAMSATRSGVSDPDMYVSADYDLTSYATHPQHLARLQAIYEAILDIESAEDADSYIRSRFPESPVTGEMAWQASEAYDVDARLVLAIMQQDSGIGTMGKGARTRNPGNVGTWEGHVTSYESWQAGVDAVAKWLNNHRTH